MLSTKLKEAAGNGADATLYVDDVFSTWLYTGTGATQTITNGIDLAGKGGLVWIKVRPSTTPHYLFDSARGFSNALNSNTTAASDPSSDRSPTPLSNGFSLPGNNYTNGASGIYASWTFRKAAKFFDVVTYTGTGSARTIAHSLGVAPGMVIVKRTDTTGNWQVYSNGLTSAAYSTQLNLTDAQASAPTVWNSTAPTSSVFSVGTDATVNASGGTYVAYLYAHDTSSTGIIQCGSFTTDGSSKATVNLGWEPQYVMSKKINAPGAWVILDTLRGIALESSGSGLALFANLNNSENASAQSYLGPNTGQGFSAVGSVSSTYIYMAIRMPNKPPTSGTQVYNAIARTGTGAVATITGVGFASDFILAKDRTSASLSFGVFDRLRGTNIDLATAVSAAEYNVASPTSYNSVTQFGNTSVNVGADQWNSYINGISPDSYITNFFARAPGFFDVVCYTGTGSTMTIPHNLTVVPELIITKSRSAVAEWIIYASPIGNTKFLMLQSTAAAATNTYIWNSTTPTNVNFYYGDLAAAGQTYVAYLFATLAGISKVGSYTGNGTGQVIACGFSAGARFVLIKRTDSTGGWYTFDSARGLTSGSSPYLLLNSTAAEVTGNNGVYASTGGFTLGSTAITTTNIATATYIFLAVS